MPGRRVEEGVKSNEATKETGGSKQPSKGRVQGRGHGRHTVSTTPHRSTGEGSTRGTREKRPRAPRHAPHRHHTHRTHQHPRPQHVASGPREPAQRAGSWGGGGRLTSDAPRNGGLQSPPGTPYRHLHGTQRRPARAHALGPVQGPHARTHRSWDTRVAEPLLPAPEDGRSGEGQRLTPDAPHNGGRPPPRGRPPTTPAARSPHRACRPRGQCWAPTPTHPRPQHVAGGPQQPAQWAGSRERDSA